MIKSPSLVKQGLCASGMRWKTTGAKIVLRLCALTQTRPPDAGLNSGIRSINSEQGAVADNIITRPHLLNFINNQVRFFGLKAILKMPIA